MRVRVLGSAAGGGFPQWNCNCPQCLGVRLGTLTAKPRTQSSIAISTQGSDWIICNTSPDILQQIASFADLQPARHIRDTGIAAVILTDGQLDHAAGLLMLRESGPIPVYCTETVHLDLNSRLPIFPLLQHYHGVQHHPIYVNQQFEVNEFNRLSFHAIELKSKSAPYSLYRDTDTSGATIGLLIEDTITAKKLFYAPGIGEMNDTILTHMQQADCILIDGSFWHDDEMLRQGVGKKYAKDMGHLALSGEGGMLEILKSLKKPRKILIHINNTNPILNEHSKERELLNDLEIEVAFDGMEICV